MTTVLLPLFIQDIATVKQRLRMSGVAETVDAQVIIEEAVRTVRAGFFRKLTIDRITQLTAIPVETNPVTADGVLRQVAEVTEQKWIRYELMRTIPTVFSDSIPSAQTAWNDEGMLRGTRPDDREFEMRRLRDDIEQAMTVLRGDEVMPKETTANTGVYVSATPPARPGESVFGCRRPLTW